MSGVMYLYVDHLNCPDVSRLSFLSNILNVMQWKN